MRSDDPRRAALEADGWRVSARSWGAQLDAEDVNFPRLAAMVLRVSDFVTVRELLSSDAGAVLALDASTIADYPGGIATTHQRLSRERAEVTLARRAFGAFSSGGELLAVTYVDITGDRAETDFTVVAAAHRGRGLGSAVKAAAVLTAVADGARILRTGGSHDNLASLAANRSVGYVVDEEWITLQRQHRSTL